MTIATSATTDFCQNLNGYCLCEHLSFFAQKEMAVDTSDTTAFLLKKRWTLLQWPLLSFAKIEMTIAAVATTAFWAKVMAINTVATAAFCQNLNGYCYCGQQYVGLTSVYPPVEKAI